MKKLLSIIAIALFLSGCSSIKEQRMVDENNNVLNQAKEFTKKYKDQPDTLFRSSTTQIFMGKPFRIKTAAQLPVEFDKPVVLSASAPVSLQEIAAQVTTITGIPVLIGEDVTDVEPFSFPHSGSMRFLLDILATRANASWEYGNGVIQFYRYKTVVYYINTLPGNTAIEASLSTETSTGESGNGGSSESGHTASMKSDVSVYKSVADAIAAMLSPGGKIVINEATGAIAVTDTQKVQEKVGSYIKRENERLTRQVVIDVQVISYSSNDTTEHGINWGAVYQSAKSLVGLATPFSILDAASALTFQVVNPSSGWRGSSLIIRALDEVGTTTIVTSAPVTTLNNQPANLVIADDEFYVSEISTEFVADVGTSQSVTQSMVSTGVTLSATPHVLDDRSMILQMAVNLSALDGFAEVPVNNADGSGVTLRSPRQGRRSFLQRVHVRSGQTLVLSGFENRTNLLRKSSPVDHSNWELGGARKANVSNDNIVILITPRIVNDGVSSG